MTQWPNEKDPHSNWLPPPEQGSKSHPPSEKAQSDWLSPPDKGQSSNSFPPPEELAPRDPQGYYPSPEGPPPDYEYAQKHGPSGSSGYAPIQGKDNEIYCVPPRPASAPIPEAGPSTASSSQNDGKSSSFLTTLSSFFGNSGPPLMWNRPAPSHFPYNTFPPMCLISNNHNVSDGFPELPPPCQMNPHPFATHDVTEEDWKRFLADVKKGGSLSPGQRLKSGLLPTVMGLNLITGFMASALVEKRMKYRNRDAAGDVIDHWNHYFFGPRRMEVVLCQASERLSGRLGTAPITDPIQERMALGLRRPGRGDDDYLSDSSSSDSEDYRRGHGYDHSHGHGDRFGRRAARRERRELRRERRGERREEKRARRGERRERRDRGENKAPYQLFITAI
ncbi:hypothetical protein JVU11DRAFT_4554 [Chiua virens]|nr:hypothetical protein JVU11DRAFT_4554 [Chiua virens]